MEDEDNREFIVEVNITLPYGESLDNWKIVGRLVEDVNEDTVAFDSKAIASKIEAEIQKFLKSQPVA